jgi:hypothetical protein
MPEPTEQDIRNAAYRADVAAKAAAEYAEAANLALATLGPGWTPWMKLVLLDSDHRHTGCTEPVVTAFKVYRGKQRLSENSVYLRKLPDGMVKRANSYEELFGDLLHEPHPTKRLEIRGELVPAPRWTLCWSSLEIYEPKTAPELATLRESREKRKAERDERKWAEKEPLWAPLAERDKREREIKGR